MRGSSLKFGVRSAHFTSSHASSSCAHVVCLILRDFSTFLFLLFIFSLIVLFMYLVFSFFFQDVVDKIPCALPQMRTLAPLLSTTLSHKMLGIAAALVEDDPSGSAAKSTPTPSCATGSSTRWTSGRRNGGGACSGACGRSSGCAPGCSTGSTERATSSTTRQEEFAVTRGHDTVQRAHHASDRRLVPQRGDDQEPGARTARRRGTRRPS